MCLMVQKDHMCVSWCKKIVCLMMQKDHMCVSHGVKGLCVCVSYGVKESCICFKWWKKHIHLMNMYVSLMVQNELVHVYAVKIIFYYICVYHRVYNLESFTIGHIKQLYIHLECCCTCSNISTPP